MEPLVLAEPLPLLLRLVVQLLPPTISCRVAARSRLCVRARARLVGQPHPTWVFVRARALARAAMGAVAADASLLAGTKRARTRVAETKGE